MPGMLGSLSLLVVVGVARAYESDQLTDRAQPLTDSRQVANERVNAILAEAASRANRRTACEGTDEQVQRLLAREIAERTGGLNFVPSPGRRPPRYFGDYAAWLETGPVDRRSFPRGSDVYSDVRLSESFVLSVFGLASTVRIGDVLLGTDKIDHFWAQGYDYWKRVQRGQLPDEVVDWGTHTELKVWGQSTTGVFSYADLAANYDGYSFFSGLLEPDSVLVRDGAGCVVQARPFDWSEWIDWRWDEVTNPSVYTPRVRGRLETWLSDHQDSICAEKPAWFDDREAELLRRALQERPAYVSGVAPSRSDPYQLDERCDGVAERSEAQ